MTRRSERGAIAAYALAILAVASILTGAWLRLVGGKVASASLDGRDAQARLLAEAGLERALAWFAEPSGMDAQVELGPTSECDPTADRGAVLRKRCVGPDGLPAYVGVDGSRQFVGTADSPGLRMIWTDASILFTPPSDSDERRGGPNQARVEVRVFAPRSLDAVATVVSVAAADRASAAVRAELIDGPWQGLPHAVAARDLGANTIPVRVHWGSVAVNGSVDLSALLDRVPRRDASAVLSGSPYPSEPGRDRWAGVSAAGTIVGPPRDASGFLPPFQHVDDGAPVGPIRIWSHAALRAFARARGTYFATRGTGLLYPADGGPGVSPSTALAAHSGSGRVVFIDTLDGLPPRADNLDTVQIAIDHLEITLYAGAHVRLSPGAGRSVTVDAPPAPDDPFGPPAARGVTVNSVHLRGALMVAGELSTTGRVNVVGALVAWRGVQDPGAVEVWYDASLRRGYHPGFPPVVIKPGSRRAVIINSP
ncbi:MAG: hypothetical protein ACOYXR_03170 [Nitrospirota bacterium]